MFRHDCVGGIKLSLDAAPSAVISKVNWISDDTILNSHNLRPIGHLMHPLRCSSAEKFLTLMTSPEIIPHNEIVTSSFAL